MEKLAKFIYDIKYRPGVDNISPDSFTPVHIVFHVNIELTEVHNGLFHPNVTCLLHFVRTRIYPFPQKMYCKENMSDAKFHRVETAILPFIKWQINQATHPWIDLSIDFKGPLPSATCNKYLLTIVDEYSRFLFAIPCPDINSTTVMKILDMIFALCGMPNYIHSADRDHPLCPVNLNVTSLKRYSNKSTPYHPIGNRQVER